MCVHCGCLQTLQKRASDFCYGWLWATMCLLEFELRTFGRAVGALNRWAISPPPRYFLFTFQMMSPFLFPLWKPTIPSPLPLLTNPPTPTSLSWHTPTMRHQALSGPRASLPIDDPLGHPWNRDFFEKKLWGKKNEIPYVGHILYIVFHQVLHRILDHEVSKMTKTKLRNEVFLENTKMSTL